MMRLNANHPFGLALTGSLWLSAALAASGQTADLGQTNASVAPAVTNGLSLEKDESHAAGQPTNAAARQPSSSRPHRHGVNRGEDVIFGRNVDIKPGETVQDVVVVGGSVTVRGKVQGDVVVCGGELDVQGKVDGDTVVFLGSEKVSTNAMVNGDAVVFLGGLQVATNATVNGDAVSFGGTVEVADGGKVQGDIVPFHFGLPKPGLPKWLRLWLTQCVFKLRPLAPGVGWVWVIAGISFLLYLFIAAVFPRPVQACVEELGRRPATTFLMGLLTKLGFVLVLVILGLTVVGLVVVPFILAALFLLALAGKVAFMEWLGSGLGRRFGLGALRKPLAAFLAGWIIITLLYLVPVLGLLTLAVVGTWGLGGAVMGAFGGLRRELPERPAPSPATPWPPVMAMAGASGPAAAMPAGNPEAGAAPPATLSMPSAPPILPDVLSYRKASFWERMGAAFLDVVLVSVLGGLAGGMPLGLLVALAYFAGMWAWKGTTIGGIVLGLKVVRFDGGPVTFPVALVRALAAAFSMCVLFLGFLWIAWDPEKQGWHEQNRRHCSPAPAPRHTASVPLRSRERSAESHFGALGA